MKKTEATNTFTGGMIMDLNPQQTPDNVLVNALNGTIITFQGNEKVLQNDMGNGRVETAFLPEKYIPLGTAELGGIIYVVSYNPIDNRCQIGSFPSPQRNLSTDEQFTSETTTVLSENDFKKGEPNQVAIYYLKKNLGNMTFSPGDKFIVYGDSIKDNYVYLYNKDLYTSDGFQTASKQTIKLELGTITSSGKLVKFSELKKYTIDNQGEYFIFDYEKDSDISADIDEYRNLVQQPYNVFSSKVSGQLVLIAELIQFNTFGVTIKNNLDGGAYKPEITYTLEGDYPFIPKGVNISGTLNTDQNIENDYDCNYDFDENELKESTSFQSYNITSNTFLPDTISQQVNEYLTDNIRSDNWTIEYTFTPCMNWGKLSFLSISGTIDLDKLGTGYINLNSWKYYVTDTVVNLNWGLDIYEEPDYNVTDVKMHLYRFINDSDIEETIYSVNNKKSYNGVFYDILPLESEDSRLSQKLVSNTLYFVDIEVTYSNQIEYTLKHFYRWLYTNSVFNSYYYKDTVKDYDSLQLNLDSDITVDYDQTLLKSQQSKLYGIIGGDAEKVPERFWSDSKSSLSGIQTYKEQEVACTCTLKLKDSYNTFDLINSTNVLNVSIGDSNISSSNTIKYTDEEDSEVESYLKSSAEITNNITQYQLEDSIYVDVSDKLMMPTNIVQVNKTPMDWQWADNTFNFKVDYANLQLVKAACTKVKDVLQYSGKIVPLAYNEATFQQYNMIPVTDTDTGSTYWKPDIIGTFCLDDSKIYLNYFTDERYGKDIEQMWGTKVVNSDNPNLKWGSNDKILKFEQEHWRNTTMFSLHWDSGDSVYIKLKNLPYKHGSGLVDDLKVFSVPMAKRDFVKQWPDKRRVQLMVKGKDSEYYYPIDFSDNSNSADWDQLFINEKLFFNYFAIILNNLFRYDTQGFSRDYIYPKAIFYMDKCTYNLNIPLSLSTKNIQKCSIKLKDSQILLSDIISKLKEKQIISGDSTISSYNVTFNLSELNNTYTLSLSDSDNTTGKKLRDYIGDIQTFDKNIAIMDYDGYTIIGNTGTASKESVYTISKNGSSVELLPAVKVPFKILSYTKSTTKQDTYNVTDQGVLEQGEENINYNFVIDSDGLLRLKAPRQDGHTEMNLVGAGTATGYQNIRLLNKYRVYS